jgi:flagellin-like hook-associated protein FlgL
MRISTNIIYNNLLSGIRNQQTIQNDGNAKISSGTRFQTPAQSGLDYKISLDIRHAQVAVQSSIDASSTVDSRLSISQTMLNDMNNLLTKAQVLAVQQASGQLGATERQAALQEMNHLADQFLSDANKTWQGQSLFAGTAVDKNAFTDDGTGNITYTGSKQDRIVSISDNQQILSNVRGDNIAFSKAFSAMQSFKSALKNNDQTAIHNSIGALNSAGNSIIDLTTEVGSRLAALRISRSSFEDLKVNLDKRLAAHEGVDIPSVMAELQQSSIALKAAYSQIAQMKSLSLTNFLR